MRSHCQVMLQIHYDLIRSALYLWFNTFRVKQYTFVSFTADKLPVFQKPFSLWHSDLVSSYIYVAIMFHPPQNPMETITILCLKLKLGNIFLIPPIRPKYLFWATSSNEITSHLWLCTLYLTCYHWWIRLDQLLSVLEMRYTVVYQMVK